MKNKVALVFSGHNQRAVISLCRFFSSIEQPYAVVAAGNADPIYNTDYRRNVVVERNDSTLSLALFERIQAVNLGKLVYCPTSEYLNRFVLENEMFLKNMDIDSGMPKRQSYELVSDKWTCQELLKGCPSLDFIDSMAISELSAPCVLKPFKNLVNGKMQYPILCTNESELTTTLSEIDISLYYGQRFIDGQSYYLCGYLNKAGKHIEMWQRNLLQQANGKSIVLAETCLNPGLDVAELWGRLSHSGYHGPVMLELMEQSGKLYFIEINPRFWGPLQLAVDNCPEILLMYQAEWLGESPKVTLQPKVTQYYAWYKGAQTQGLRRYKGANRISDTESLLRQFDVYNRQDTQKLHSII